jgi:hypothetical protein
MRSQRFSLLLLLLTTSVLMGLAILYVYLHLITPFDGGRLEFVTHSILSDGLRVTPPKPSPGGLQTGDIVTAVEGRSIEWWTEAQLKGNAPRPSWLSERTEESQRYTIRRGNQQIDAIIQMTPYPWWTIFRDNWGLIAFGLIALLIAAYMLIQQPQHRAVRVLYLSSAAVLAAAIPWSFSTQVSDFLDSRAFWLYWGLTMIAYTLFWIGILHFILIFPQPLPFMIGRWRVPALYGIPYLLFLIHLLAIRPGATTTLAWIATWKSIQDGYVLILLVLILLVGIWQYRRNQEGVARQQIRWIVFALLLSGGLTLVLDILPVFLGLPTININLVGLIALIFPLGIAAAILRHHLFDIDVIIRRTLVYSVLTTLLALIYFASVVLLQYLLTDLIGAGSTVAIVISTLLIAALFTPLRRRVQDMIDRRFYRRRYDAQQVLASFAATIRNETDPDQLTAELVRVVQETVQPAHVSVWHVKRQP